MCCSPRFLDVVKIVHILNAINCKLEGLIVLSIKDLVKNINDVVSLPGVFVRVNAMVNNPKCSMDEVAAVISQDPGLTIRVLRMANSPAYGISKEIDSVKKAATIIGTERIRDIALATSAVETFEGIPNNLVSMEDFWMHSIYCAITAKYLASLAKISNPDSLFVAGLLHDVGQLVLFNVLPEESRKVLEYVLDDTEGTEINTIEQDLLGFDHAMVGGALAESWHLTPMLVEVITAHHDLSAATEFKKQSAIVKIANSIAVMAELDSIHIEETDAALVSDADWIAAGFDAAEADSIMEQAVHNAQESYKDVQKLLMIEH